MWRTLSSRTTSQKGLDGKLKKLEDDFTATQKDVTERALKKAQRERPYEFCRKGHKEQFAFNAEVGDRIDPAARKMSKLGPTSEDKATLQQAMSELKEGMDMIAERQKHIRITNQSEHHWETVAAYKGSDVADDEEDARRIEKAERTAEQLVNRKKRKAAISSTGQRAKRPPPPPEQLPSSAPTAVRPQLNPGRPIGPYYSCWQMGHLKVNCPSSKTVKPMYHFSIKKCMTRGAIIGVVSETDSAGAMQGKTRYQVGSESSTVPVESVINSVARVCDVQSVNSISASSAITPVTLKDNVLTTFSSVNSALASSRVTTVYDVLATHNNVSCPIVTSACEGPSGDAIPHCPVIASIDPMVQGSNKVSPGRANEPAVSRSCETVVNWEQSTGDAELQSSNCTSMCKGSGEHYEDGFGTGEPLLDPALCGFWEIEQGEGQITNVQGRLWRSLNFLLNELDPAP